MSTSGYAARVGAAAFVLGMTLGAPLAGTAPVAAADAPDTAVSDAADTGSTATPARTGRGPKANSRGGDVERPTSARPASADHSRRGRTVAADAAGTRPSATVAVPDSVRAPAATARPAVQPPAGESAAIPAATAPAGRPVTRTEVLPEPTPAPATAPAASMAAPPTAPAAVSAPAGAAASSFAKVVNGLFGSGRGLAEGAGLLWRRRLPNQAPTVNPVQLTGLIDGPITGTIGAVDPEGDPLRYAVTGDPWYGTVTVSQDGAYTYTPGTNFAGSDTFVVAVTDTGRRINLRKRPKSTEASVSVAQGVQAPTLRFQFSYGSGARFWSPEARSALESAAARLAGYFVVSSPLTITYAVTGQSSPFSSTLASAGSDFVDSEPGFVQTVVQKKIQTGIDSNGSAADGDISWNFGPSWGFGDTVSNSEYDFQSTAMHELLHTLGFLSYADRAGNNTGENWTVYDRYLVDSDGTAAIGSDYRWQTAYNPNLTGGDGGLFFGGPSAVAAHGGLVPLYTPMPFSSGSSLSHLDDYSFTGAQEQMMNAVSGRGSGIRVLSPVELGVLADIGYELAPGTSALIFAGFFFTRRPRTRKK